MNCKHRFTKELKPDWDIKYLFVGTFNPEWNSGEDDGEYFYGRPKNMFWCVMPHAFNSKCLIDKGRTEWVEFCKKKGIGITDLIKAVKNVDIIDKNHLKDILSYSDTILENYDLMFNIAGIKDIINNNEKLSGIFFTRKTAQSIPKIWKQWEIVKKYAENKGIKTVELPTTSLRGRNWSIRSKIDEWKQAILSNKVK